MRFNTYTTNYAKNLFWDEHAVLEDDIDVMRVVNIYTEVTYQKVHGFGGAFTEASGYNLSLLSQMQQKAVIDAYFGEGGLNYNLCRTHINSCDFALGNYAYMDAESDTSLKGFSINRDKQYILPMIKKAQETSEKEIKLLASPWSPPAFMKTNEKMNNGGALKTSYYEMWADYIVKYIECYLEEGVEISALTVQNEPQAVQTWDSCIYSSEEERDFVKCYLGPKLKEAGLERIRVFIWDHNKESLFERAEAILEDMSAREYIDGVAFHWYTGDHFDAISLVRQKYPEKVLYFTEGCVEYSRFMDSNEVTKAEMYAHDMIGNFKAGMNAYIDWNMLLDEKGGPNHVGNFCAAPIMCNPAEDLIEKRLSYYYIGHLSRFVKVGAVQVATTKYTDQIDVVAFLNPDGERVVVILNKSDKDIPISLREYEVGRRCTVERHSIMTICYK